MLRSAPALVAIVGLLGGGASACRLAGPSPDRERSAMRAPSTARPTAPPRERISLVLRLGERRLYLMDDASGAALDSFPIAVGREGYETPTGRFRVEEMIERPDFHQIDPNDRSRVIKRIPPGPANPLGERWIAFAHGDGWTTGIHGTPQPELLGRAVSKGCVRMRNADVVRVYERVRIGTPVVVLP